MPFYDALFSLWDHWFETGKMDRELKSRIGGVKAQMTTFSFFFGLQLGYRLYAITDNLSKALQEKKMSAISSQRLARATLSTIEAMRNDESFDMFYEHVLKKAEGHNMVEELKKGRKQPKPKYSILQHVDAYNKGEAHYPETEKYKFQQIYFEAVNYFVVPLKERFEQPTYVICATIESLLLSLTHGKTPDYDGMKMIRENYSDEMDILSLDVEIPILKQVFKDTPVVCLSDIVDKLQLLPDER